MINPAQATSNFNEIYRIYQGIFSHVVEDYESEKVKLILPLVPPPILRSLCDEATKIFQKEPNMIVINDDVTVVGDLHGQILDLFRILNLMGEPPDRNYLFLGDFVDRGDFSTETITLVLILKVLFPSNIFIIRGNHEFSEMFTRCGFSNELSSIYPEENVLTSFEDCFAYMPLAALVNDSILCVHGGIGPSFNTLGQISDIKRPLYGYDDDIIMSIVWSDPSPNIDTYAPSARGSGYLFGSEALSRFLQSQVLDFVVRGHESIDSGVQQQLKGKIATVFSASNYCGMLNNKSGVLQLNKDKTRKSFTFAPLVYFRRDQAAFVESENELIFIPSPNIKEPSHASLTMQSLPSLDRVPVGGRIGNDFPSFRRMSGSIPANMARRPSKISPSATGFSIGMANTLPKRRLSTIDPKRSITGRRDSTIKKSPSFQSSIPTLQPSVMKRKSVDLGRNAPSPRRFPLSKENNDELQVDTSNNETPESNPSPLSPDFSEDHDELQPISISTPASPIQPVLPSYSRGQICPRRYIYNASEPSTPAKPHGIHMPTEESFPSFRKRNFNNVTKVTETK